MPRSLCTSHAAFVYGLTEVLDKPRSTKFRNAVRQCNEALNCGSHVAWLPKSPGCAKSIKAHRSCVGKYIQCFVVSPHGLRIAATATRGYTGDIIVKISSAEVFKASRSWAPTLANTRAESLEGLDVMSRPGSVAVPQTTEHLVGLVASRATSLSRPFSGCSG